MIILGLTGSIGMGKSTVAQMLAHGLKVPVWDADQESRQFLFHSSSVRQALHQRFPQLLGLPPAQERQNIKELAFHSHAFLDALEALLHPLLLQSCRVFLQKNQRLGIPLCVLDVPLLFEVGWDHLCTHTVVASAPAFLQSQRVLRRRHMDQEQLDFVLSRQMPDAEKRLRATFIVYTGLSKGHTFSQVRQLFGTI